MKYLESEIEIPQTAPGDDEIQVLKAGIVPVQIFSVGESYGIPLKIEQIA